MPTHEKDPHHKLRLLIATDSFLPRWDGISRFLSEIIPRLEEIYDITVVAPHFGPYEAKGFKLVTIPVGKRGAGDYRLAKYKPGIIRKLVRQSDMVFTQTIGTIGATAINQAKRMHIPVASFIHSIEWELVPMATKNINFRRVLYPLMKFYTRRLYNKSNLLLVPSEGIADILAWQGIRTRKYVVNLGVDCDDFKPMDQRTDEEKKLIEGLREKLGLSGTFVIGYHGRLAREKDLFTQYRAFSWLQKRYPNLKLLLIGNGEEEIIRKLKKARDVVIVSSTNKVNLCLNLMNIYVISSMTETTSLSTLEAMATGLPVVATPVGFIKEYIRDSYNGFLFPIRDAYALHKELVLIKNNPGLAANVGRRARETVMKSFTWDKTLDGIRTALKTLE